MKVVVLILVLAVFQTRGYDDECDKLGILIYEDLGCTPVKEANDKCPKRYKCPDFNRQNNSCIFKAVDYQEGDVLNDDLVYPACHVNCMCRKPKQFICAALDCPEWLGYEAAPNCHLKYDLEKCCSVGEICPPFKTTCEYDNKTYKDGERFYPKNSCKSCVCKKNFNGTLEEPFCKKETCASEIDHSGEIASFCAPSYFKFSSTNDESEEYLCCPHTWICPEGNEEVKQINKDVEKNSDLRCKFGKTMRIKLGFGFEKTINQYGKTRNLRCECQVPPFMTCKETN